MQGLADHPRVDHAIGILLTRGLSWEESEDHLHRLADRVGTLDEAGDHLLAGLDDEGVGPELPVARGPALTTSCGGAGWLDPVAGQTSAGVHGAGFGPALPVAGRPGLVPLL